MIECGKVNNKMTKIIIGSGAFFGSTLGGYIPTLWGGSVFSFSSIFLSVVGGLIGIWIGYRISQYLGFS